MDVLLMFSRFLMIPAMQKVYMEAKANQVVRLLKKHKMDLSKTLNDLKHLCATVDLENVSSECKGLEWWIFNSTPMRCYGIWWPIFQMSHGDRHIKEKPTMSEYDMYSFFIILSLKLQEELQHV